MKSTVLVLIYFFVSSMGLTQENWQEIYTSAFETTVKGIEYKKIFVNLLDVRGNKLNGKVTFISEGKTYEAIYIEHHKIFLFDTIPSTKGTLTVTSEGFETQSREIILNLTKPYEFRLGEPGCDYTVLNNVLYPQTNSKSYVVNLKDEESFKSVQPMLDSMGLLYSNGMSELIFQSIPVSMQGISTIPILIDEVDSTQQIRYRLLKHPEIVGVHAMVDCIFPSAWATGELGIGFSKKLTRAEINELLKKYSLKIVEREIPYFYRVTVTEKSIGSVHEVAKQLREEDRIEYVSVVFQPEYVESPPIH